MANTVALGVRISPKLKKILDQVCELKGLVMGRFVEDALIDKLEEIEDFEELSKLRKEPRRSLSAIMKELGYT